MSNYWYTDSLGRKRHVQESSETYFSKDYKNSNDLISRFSYKELTHKTNCPTCHKKVFFIRHNGGNIWVDSLGWPWPKHSCFESLLEPKLYNFFKKNIIDNLSVITGVVRSAKWEPSKNKQYSKINLIINFEQGCFNVSIPVLFTLDSIEKTLVLVDIKNKKIIFSSYIESNIVDCSANNQSDITISENKSKNTIKD